MRPLLLSLLLLAACGPAGEPPDPRDYDASCDTVDDCALVVWEACGCDCDSYFALNTKAATAFEADQDPFIGAKSCEKTCDLGCFTLPPAGEVTLECVQGTCEATYEYSSYR